MNSKFPFSIVRFEPPSSRGERINIGLIVFKDSNVDVRLEPSNSRQILLREYGASDELARLENTLRHWGNAGYTDEGWEGAYRSLSLSSKWQLSSLGCFYASSHDQYEAEIRSLLDDLVAPVGSSRTGASRRRLNTELRDEFGRIGVLSPTEEDFEHGYVIPRLPLKIGAATLRVDFAAKKGRDVYLIQTVDLSGPDASEKIRDASYKSLIIDRARTAFNAKAHAIFVTRTSSIDSDAQDTCREIIKAYANSVIDFDSERQRVELLAHFSRLKARSGDLFRSGRSALPSDQEKLKLYN